MMIVETDGLNIHLFVWDYVDSNAYMMIENSSALVVDPVDTEEFWGFLEKKGIHDIDVVLTHEHFDHISGLNKIREKWNCVVYAQRKCSENIEIATRNLSSVANVLVQISEKVQKKNVIIESFVCKPTEVIFDKTYTFLWQNHSIELVAIPGHSAGSICMILDGELLFSGDSLLAIPTITRLPGGDKKAFKEITQPWLRERLTRMRWIFPGHGNAWKNSFFCSDRDTEMLR